jgi:NAD(P)-dependent dehydrogenase (short-subunit alcohol dehydrogenase family)
MALHGTIALVTGAGRRLGRAIALSLAEHGADIVLHVHTASGEDIAQEVVALGRQVIIVRADLSRPVEASRLSQEALAIAGHIDVLVNNAAVFIHTPLPTLTPASWRLVLQTNLTAPFLLSLSLGRAMRARGSGKILQLGDWSGVRPLPGYLPYCVAKGGVHLLTQALAKALAPQVQVNEIAPGPVLPPASYDTAARQALIHNTPLGRLGRAEDVARAVRFLVERGRGVTGATYVVDGGWLASAPSGRETSS